MATVITEMPADRHAGTPVSEIDQPADRQEWMEQDDACRILARKPRTLREWARKGKIARRHNRYGHTEYLVDRPNGSPVVDMPTDAGEPAITGGSANAATMEAADLAADVDQDAGTSVPIVDHMTGEINYLREELAGVHRQLEAKDADLRETRLRLDALTGLVMSHLHQLPAPAADEPAEDADMPAEETPPPHHDVTIRGANGSRPWWRRFFF
jgi:hypothetical protein